MKMRRLLFLVLFFISLSFQTCFAEDSWEFKLIHETLQLINSPFFLMTAADLNKNGTKELIVTDFGRFGDHIEEWKQWKQDSTDNYNLFILEWEKGSLKTKWSKRWDMTKIPGGIERHKYFLAFEANQMVSWEIGDKVVVETIPPYLGLEWAKDKYILREQQGPFNTGQLVGSWIFPWLSASCYQSFPNKTTWPRECLVGIRDFSKDGNPKIVTILEEETIRKNQYKQTLRVRKFEPGFPVEWEKESPKRFGWWTPGWEVYVDRLNHSANQLLLFEFWRPEAAEAISPRSWHLFKPVENDGQSYQLKPVQAKGQMELYHYDLPDVYLRKTQKKNIEEYWGYRFAKAPDKGNILLLRKVVLKSDLSGFIKEDINFDHHKSFLGVGYFDLRDIDGDGLDELILIEETGKREFGFETIFYSDTKDYIRILKWDGKQYKTMWVSPPYTKRGTKFLIEDIKNTGKKQLVVMTSNGTIQIWERK